MSNIELAVVYLVIGVLGYFLPTIITIGRENFWKVFIVNLLTGWSVIGWVLAIYMSVNGRPR